MKIQLTTYMILFVCSITFAQQDPPARMNYQAAIRQNDGSPVKNQNVTMQFSILENSPTGTTLYVERQNTTTNEFGLVNLTIGTGQVISGTLNAINWNSGQKWMKVELDASGGTNFSALGTTELVSVPYAMSSGSTTRIQNKPVNASTPAVGQVLKWNGTEWTPSNDNTGGGSGPSYIAGSGINIDANNVINNTGDLSNSNELQTLSLTGNNLTLSNGGGSVTLPVGGDNDATNEIQTLSISGTVLSLSKGGGSITIPTGSGGTGDNWGTQSVVVEPELIGNGTNANPLGIMAEGVDTTHFSKVGAITNETFVYNGTKWTTAKPVHISGGQGISVQESVTGPLNYTMNAADPDPTNEIQSLSITGTNLTLSSGGGSVTLPDASATNELQTLTALNINGNIQLNLEPNGGSVSLGAQLWEKVSSSDNIVNSNIGKVGIGIDPSFLDSRLGVDGYAYATDGFKFGSGGYLKEAGPGQTQVNGDFVPSTNNGNWLGNQTKQWQTIYLGTSAIFGNNATLGFNANGLTLNQSFLPFNSALYNLGSINYRWNNLYINSSALIGSLELSGQTIKTNTGSNPALYFSGIPSVDPNSNNITSLGASSFKWKDVWAVNGMIQTSDESTKSNIRPLSYGLQQVMQMNPVAWNWKEEQTPSGTHLGFIAQDIEKIVPDVVVKPTEADYAECKKRKEAGGVEGHPTYGMRYAELIPVLTKAIQEQQEIIQKQESNMKLQEQLIKELESRVKLLENK